MVVPESLKLNNTSAVYSPKSPKDSPPRRKMGYKPPTPPRSFKRKSSPKVHRSSPPAPYTPSPTTVLSSSSPSNYSSHSPFQQPLTKTTAFTSDTATYSIPSVTYADNAYDTGAAYAAPEEPYSALYNPEDEHSNSYSTPSPESYHIPGANPPPPVAFMNPPPPSTNYPPHPMARNPSPTDNYQQTGNEYQPPRSYSPGTGYDERGEEYPIASSIPPPDFSVPPPSNNEYKPFYSSSNNLTMPPLLGEDCPPTSTTSLDRFLQGSNENSQNGPSIESGFSSFMGNLNLSFEFQVSFTYTVKTLVCLTLGSTSCIIM